MSFSSDNENLIRLRGVRVHNLKEIDLDIQRGRLITVCGVSGSGKTSLALDTLYAEGQRRYIESFSPQTRQYLSQWEKPDAELIDGIPPAIAVARANPTSTNRTTIGTATEILDYLRLLYSKLAEFRCPACDIPIRSHSPQSVAQAVMARGGEGRFMIVSPLTSNGSRLSEIDWEQHKQAGFARVVLDQEMFDITSLPPDLSRFAKGGLIIDRLQQGKFTETRLTDSLETAFRIGDGAIELWWASDSESGRWSFDGYYRRLQCGKCHSVYPSPEMKLFNFSNPLGACEACVGEGVRLGIDRELIFPEMHRTLGDGAVACWRETGQQDYQRRFLDQCERLGIRTNVPLRELSPDDLELIWAGRKEDAPLAILPFFDELTKSKLTAAMRAYVQRWQSHQVCENCRGTRLNRNARSWYLCGIDLGGLCKLPIEAILKRVAEFVFQSEAERIAKPLTKEISSRLQFLSDVGLAYLSLDRPICTLSRGETQRVALTTALGSSLVNMLYVLDEPTSGMHPHDIPPLQKCIRRLCDRSNTVMLVEHQAEMIRDSDEIIEMGPGAGDSGGEVVFQGTFDELKSAANSVTGQFFRGERGVLSASKRRPTNRGWIRLINARGNNLKNVTIEFPLGVLCLVTGVSGAGKSSLVQETLYGAICRRKRVPCEKPLPYGDLLGDGQIDEVVLVDQTPIGRSPRSNPVTYIKAFDEIRSVFATTIDAKTRNFTASDFSFNGEGGRCPRCQGDGVLKIDMQFLADSYVRCPDCRGTRYRKEILKVQYRNRNISEVLNMTVRAAFSFFRGQVKVQTKLKQLMDVGLDYLRLGQAANTLSSGEAQRLKLANFMTASKRSRTLFILEEPTAGLHFADVVQLLDCFDSLLAVGHSIIVVDHNPRLMVAADYIIDVGPEAGDNGGEVVGKGTPEELTENERSHTGQYLKKVLQEIASRE